MDLAALPQPVLHTLCEAFPIRITYDHETRRAHYYAGIEAGSLDGLSNMIMRRAQICGARAGDAADPVPGAG